MSSSQRYSDTKLKTIEDLIELI